MSCLGPLPRQESSELPGRSDVVQRCFHHFRHFSIIPSIPCSNCSGSNSIQQISVWPLFDSDHAWYACEVWIVKLNWNSQNFANLCWAFQNWCQAVPRRPKIRHRPTPQPTPQPGPLTRLTCRTLLMRRMRIPCRSPKRPTRRKKKRRLRCNLHSSCQAGPRLPGKFLQRIAASTSFRRFCGSVPVHNLLRSGSSLAPC